MPKGKRKRRDNDPADKPRPIRKSRVPEDYYDHEMMQIKQMLARQRGNILCRCGHEYSADLANCPSCA